MSGLFEVVHPKKYRVDVIVSNLKHLFFTGWQLQSLIKMPQVEMVLKKDRGSV